MDSTRRTIDGAQKLRALERANRVRSARAQLKRQVAAEELTAAEVILSSRWELDRMTVGELLLSQRHWGEVRSRRFLARLGLGAGKTIGSLTARQRIASAALLTRGQSASRQSDHTASMRAQAVEIAPPMS